MADPGSCKDDPDYGDLIEGPPYESIQVGFAFAVTRFSKHPEVALDFLRFMASRKNNEELNKIIGWIPAIEGAKVDPALAAFEPKFRGVYSAWDIALGGGTIVKWEQLYALYQVGQISLEEMVTEFDDYYRSNGEKDYFEQSRDWRRRLISEEQFLEGVAAKARLAGKGGEAATLWQSYSALVTGRQVRPEIDHAIQEHWIKNPGSVGRYGPMEYTPEALEHAKEQARELAAQPGGTGL